MPQSLVEDSNVIAQSQLKQSLRGAGTLPVSAVFATAKNATAVTSTSYQAIVAAPGVGQSLWIFRATYANLTTATIPQITLADTTGTPIILDVAEPGGGAEVVHVFNPPIQVATNQGISAKADSSTGSTTVVLHYATAATP